MALLMYTMTPLPLEIVALGGICDPTQRAHKLLRWCHSETADRVVEVFAALVRNIQYGDAVSRVVWLSLCHILWRKLLTYDAQAQIYDAAISNNFKSLAVLFLGGICQRYANRSGSVQQRPATLGHRKTWARRPVAQLIDRLVADPEPEVVEYLLKNALMTLDRVVRLAAKRPTTGAVQLQIVSVDRWIAHVEVQRAIVWNPYSPTDISLPLVPLIRRQDLAELLHASALHEALRDTSATLLRDDGL